MEDKRRRILGWKPYIKILFFTNKKIVTWKQKKLFSLLLLSIFYSCQESDNAIYTPLPEAKVLTDCELIFRFDTEYPLQVQEKDSLLFLTSRKSDKCITVINKNTKSVSQKFANRGMGPNDAIDPEFIVNNYLYNDSLLYIFRSIPVHFPAAY